MKEYAVPICLIDGELCKWTCLWANETEGAVGPELPWILNGFAMNTYNVDTIYMVCLADNLARSLYGTFPLWMLHYTNRANNQFSSLRVQTLKHFPSKFHPQISEMHLIHKTVIQLIRSLKSTDDAIIVVQLHLDSNEDNHEVTQSWRSNKQGIPNLPM